MPRKPARQALCDECHEGAEINKNDRKIGAAESSWPPSPNTGATPQRAIRNTLSTSRSRGPYTVGGRTITRGAPRLSLPPLPPACCDHTRSPASAARCR